MRPERICWVGHPYFSGSLSGFGVEVIPVPASYPDFLAWDDLVRASGGTPDLVVLGDVSLPPFLLGLESFPCPTVFYCVDSHIHSWHPLYAQAFDLVLVSLRDHLPRFAATDRDRSRVLWSPPFARDGDGPGPGPQEWDLLFNGRVDPNTTPGRTALLSALAHLVPGLVLTSGPYGEYFHRARLVLNVAEAGDLNFRVFEALGSGACLLTPAVGHGLTELFRDGRDLFLYRPEDLEGLAALVRNCLADPGRCADVAASGLSRVDAAHRARHRARAFLDWLAGLDATALARGRVGRAALVRENCLRPLYLHWSEALADSPDLSRAYLRAAGPRRGR